MVSTKRQQQYAVCPKCENPIRLVNVTGKVNPGEVLYGSHENKRIEGFPLFDSEAFHTCPYVRKNLNPRPWDRRAVSELAVRIMRIAVDNFDRVVLVLRRDLGICFSNEVASDMLDAWFGIEGHCYRGANLENVPWMIAYFAPVMNLLGKDLSRNPGLIEAIKRRVPNAQIVNGRQIKGSDFCLLGLTSLSHRITRDGKEVAESLTISVRDFSKTKVPLVAPLVHQRVLTIDPTGFERLCNFPEGLGNRDKPLLQIARDIARKDNAPI